MKRICTHRNKKQQKLPYLGTLIEKPAVRVGLPHILRKKNNVQKVAGLATDPGLTFWLM